MLAAEVSASVTDSVVTFSRLCSKKNSFEVPYLRRTFEVRYEVHGDAFLMVLPLRILEEAGFLTRVTLLPVLGQSANPHLVGKTLDRR